MIRPISICLLFLSLPLARPGPDIVVGMSAAFTGPSRGLGIEMYRGASAYFAEVNSRGGVHGRKIVLRAYDDGYNPSPALANTRKLIRDDEAYLLFGYVGTPTTARVLPLLESHKKESVFLFAPFTGAELLREGPYASRVFNFRASYQEETAGLVDQFVKLGRKRIAVFYQIDAYGRSGWDGVRRALGRHGLKICAEATYRRGDPFDRLDEAPRRDPRRRQARRDRLRRGLRRVRRLHPRRARRRPRRADRQPLVRRQRKPARPAGDARARRAGRDYTRDLINSQVVPSHTQTDLPGVRLYRELMAKHKPAAPADGQRHLPAARPQFHGPRGLPGGAAARRAAREAGQDARPRAGCPAPWELGAVDLGLAQEGLASPRADAPAGRRSISPWSSAGNSSRWRTGSGGGDDPLQPLLARADRRRGAVRRRRRLVGVLAALVLAETLDRQYRSKGEAIATIIAGASVDDILLDRDAGSLQALVDQYAETEGVSYILVHNRAGEVIAHTFAPEVPAELLGLIGEEQRASAPPPAGRGEDHLDITAPILDGEIGHVHVGMDQAAIDATFWKSVRRQALALGGIGLLAAAGGLPAGEPDHAPAPPAGRPRPPHRRRGDPRRARPAPSPTSWPRSRAARRGGPTRRGHRQHARDPGRAGAATPRRPAEPAAQRVPFPLAHRERGGHRGPARRRRPGRYLSPSFGRVLDFPPAEWLGRHARPARPPARTAPSSSRRSAICASTELRMTRADGLWRVMDLSTARRLASDAGGGGIVATFRDITDRSGRGNSRRPRRPPRRRAGSRANSSRTCRTSCSRR